MDFTDALGNKHTLPDGESVGKRVSVYPVVVNEKNELLVFMPKYNPQWQLPGGGVNLESNETMVQAAERECLEETGYHIKITDEQPILVNKNNFYHRTEKKFYFSEHFFFHASLISDVPDHVSNEDSEGKVAWIKIEDLNKENSHQIIQEVIGLLRDKNRAAVWA